MRHKHIGNIAGRLTAEYSDAVGELEDTTFIVMVADIRPQPLLGSKGRLDYRYSTVAIEVVRQQALFIRNELNDNYSLPMIFDT